MSLHSVRHTEATRDHIAKATLLLVAERGSDHVTTADVVKILGVTRAEMARHCPTEDDLWRTTAEFVEKRMADAWNAIEANDQLPADQLHSLLAAQIELIMNMPALREMLFSRGLHGSNTTLRRGLCGVRAQFRSLLSDILRKGIRDDQFPPHLDPGKTARRLTEILQGMILSWSLGVRDDDVIEEVWATVDVLLGTSGQLLIVAAEREADRDTEGL